MTFTPPTVLAIDGIDLGDYSARGLTMMLAPIVNSNGLRRSVNGELLDLTAESQRKFSASISCTDQEAPVLVDVWQGKTVTVTCIPELGAAQDSTGGPGILTLNMMVDSWTVSRDEYGAEGTWTINLLEV